MINKFDILKVLGRETSYSVKMMNPHINCSSEAFFKNHIVRWQIKGPICNFENCSGETKEEREKCNTKPKKALTVKLPMMQCKV